jgi:hypothetical protein
MLHYILHRLSPPSSESEGHGHVILHPACRETTLITQK